MTTQVMPPTLSVLEKKSYQRSVWKNGLGFTDQIAIQPPGADLKRADFLWRLSSARIERDSPFSLFPEHDRILLILEGAGVRISHQYSPDEEGELADVLPLEPYEFPGDVPTQCSLLKGPVVDLSLFLRKGVMDSAVEVREVPPGEVEIWSPMGSWNFALVAQGVFEISGAGATTSPRRLAMGDTARVDFHSPETSFQGFHFKSLGREAGRLILISLGLQS